MANVRQYIELRMTELVVQGYTHKSALLTALTERLTAIENRLGMTHNNALSDIDMFQAQTEVDRG